MSYYSYEVGKRSSKSEIDALIDWYEKFRPGKQNKIPVNLGEKQLARALKRKNDKGRYILEPEVTYRGHVLVAIGEDPEPKAAKA